MISCKSDNIDQEILNINLLFHNINNIYIKYRNYLNITVKLLFYNEGIRDCRGMNRL